MVPVVVRLRAFVLRMKSSSSALKNTRRIRHRGYGILRQAQDERFWSTGCRLMTWLFKSRFRIASLPRVLISTSSLSPNPPKGLALALTQGLMGRGRRTGQARFQ